MVKKNANNITNFLNGTKAQTNFHRIQFPLAPYFAITSYKIQSKTKANLIIDLCSPNRAIYNNDAYVKLGRVKTLEGLKILRNFTLKDLKRPKDPDIDLELIRLQKLSEITIENYKKHYNL